MLRKEKIMRRNPKAEWELWSAVRSLAHQPDNIRERLANAYEFHFCYIKDDDMPTEELKKKLSNAQSKLTKNHTQPVREAIKKMRLKTCKAIADDICYLYYDYAHFEWKEREGLNPHFSATRIHSGII